MENIFDKFKKLNLDTSPIGLSIELREPFFCTPIGAQIIGWDNGIHYCFIKGFKEIVFCVNPETCCNYYVYPLAKDFTDFLRLLLSLKTTNAIQQVVWIENAIKLSSQWNHLFHSFQSRNPLMFYGKIIQIMKYKVNII